MIKIESARKITEDDELIDSSTMYIQKVHGDSKGYITRATKQPEYRQWHYKIMELLEQGYDGENVFISMNTFFKPSRRLENLKQIRALFIDLDIYKAGYDNKKSVVYLLENDYFNGQIPRANLILDSGRGLYIIWLLEYVPCSLLPLWSAVQKKFCEVLKDLGADERAIDAARILRVPDSINSKTGTKVTILRYYDYRYTLKEIQDNYLPKLQPKVKKRGRPAKLTYLYNEYSLYYARIQDLIKICELRKYKMTGYRELTLFLYRYWLCYFIADIEKALNDTLELNSQFTEPLKENEVVINTKSAQRAYLDKNKEYKYTNERLIEILDITADEQVKLKSIISKAESKRRKNLRNKKDYNKNKDIKLEKAKTNYQSNKNIILKKAKINYINKLKSEGKLTKQEQIVERRETIKALLDEGLNRTAICNKLNISFKTYERILNDIS